MELKNVENTLLYSVLIMSKGFVQLSTIGQDKYPGTPVIRWHQTADYGYVPNEILPVNSCLLFLYLPIFLS